MSDADLPVATPAPLPAPAVAAPATVEQPAAVAVAAAVVAPAPRDPASLVHHSFPVRQPEEDLLEFMVRVRASILRRARGKATLLAKPSFPWEEVLLAISTTATGAVLGGLTATFQAGSKMEVLFQSILPAIAVGTFVAYLFLRNISRTNSAQLARDIIENIPDPDKSR